MGQQEEHPEIVPRGMSNEFLTRTKIQMVYAEGDVNVESIFLFGVCPVAMQMVYLLYTLVTNRGQLMRQITDGPVASTTSCQKRSERGKPKGSHESMITIPSLMGRTRISSLMCESINYMLLQLRYPT